MGTIVIGIDCATKASKTGLARASWDGQHLRLEEACIASREATPAERIAAWVGDARSVMIALDAPLGWPCALDLYGNGSCGKPCSTHRRGRRGRYDLGRAGNRPADRWRLRHAGAWQKQLKNVKDDVMIYQVTGKAL